MQKNKIKEEIEIEHNNNNTLKDTRRGIIVRSKEVMKKLREKVGKD